MDFKLMSVLAAGVLSAAPAFSATVTLDFETAPSFDSIGDLYAAQGISFGLDALGVPPSDAAGTYHANAPSPLAVMSPVGPSAALNAAGGLWFEGSASFHYSSTEALSVGVYSGLNGTGTLLGTFALAANAQNGCDNATFCHWDLVSLTFGGAAQSIQFGEALYAGFDDVTVNPVPLPAAAWLLLSGLGGLGALVRRKRNV